MSESLLTAIQKRLQRAQGQTGVNKSARDITNPPVPPQALPNRNEAGQFVSSQYSADSEGQPFSSSSDDWTGGAPTESSASRGPGTSPVQVAWARKQNNVQRIPLLVKSPMARMMASIAATQQVKEWAAGSTDGAPPMVYNPATIVAPADLNPYQYKEYVTKLQAMVSAYHAATGTYPAFGAPLSADDQEFQIAADELLRRYYGPSD